MQNQQPAVNERKCDRCKGKLCIKPQAFYFRGKYHDLPHCTICNLIFEQDMVPIIKAEMQRVYEFGEKY